MIHIKNLCLEFGEQVIYNNVNLTIESYDRIGLVGRNGAGKSTLLKIIAGQQSYDSGQISISKQKTIAYMPQDMVIASTKNVIDEALATNPALYTLKIELEKIEALFDAGQEVDAATVEKYAELQHEALELDLYGTIAQIDKMLSGLNFDEKKKNSLVSELSVGWRMRLVLAKLLLQKADFYLFDEPTNHLDLHTKAWFLDFLQNSSFGFLLVCHDKYFLDKVCTSTFALQFGQGKLYNGNYSYYKKVYEEERELLEKQYEEQQKMLKAKMATIDRFRAGTKAKMAQSMLKDLEKIERIEIGPTEKTITVSVPPVQKSGKDVLEISNVAHTFETPIFKNANCTIYRGEKIALVAPNGTGKTTLFNLIAKKLTLQTGSIEEGYQVTTALFDQDQEKVLGPNNNLLQEVTSYTQASEQKARAMLGAFLFSNDDVFKLTKVLSGGERNRVAMVKVLLKNANFLMLDEPTNHLDLESKEIVLQALQKFDGTLLFVSHDQDFVNRLATRILELTPQGLKSFPGNYDAYLLFKAQEAAKEETVITKNKSTKNSATSTSSTKQNSADLEKKCHSLETKIDKLSKELSFITQKFFEYEYGTKEYNKAVEEQLRVEKQLQAATTEWEALQTELDTLQN